MEIAIASRLVSKGEIGIARAQLAGGIYAYTENDSYRGIEARDICDSPPRIVRPAGFPFYQESVPNLKTLAYISAKGCFTAWN